MKFLLLCPLLVAILNVEKIAADVGKLVCFYDSSSFIRDGPAELSLNDLSIALQFCNYLIYGYAGIDAETYQLKSLNADLDINRDHYRFITALKRNNPQLRILLSVGGDKDLPYIGEPNKYLLLLEETGRRQSFVSSVTNIIKTYGFDGLDLAWQFPKDHPKVVSGGVKKAWRKFKNWFTGPKVVDEKAEEHKEQFTSLVRELKAAFRQNAAMLTLTMLPHVNAELFIDVFTVTPNLDFINLATFDFQTPFRDPKVADYPASLYELYERDPTHNIDYHVRYWLTKTAPANKLYIGIAGYGRAWKMTSDSGITGYPPIPSTDGAAYDEHFTIMPGLLSWPEICAKLEKPTNKADSVGAEEPLRKVGDPTQRYGSYAYRAADENGKNGVWVGYEDPITAAAKTGYVHVKGLGGVAFFDLSMDDFNGECAGEKFPILRSIKYKL